MLAHALKDLDTPPTRLLEVGSALGRGLYEIYRRTPSLRSATLVEPSETLALLSQGHETGNWRRDCPPTFASCKFLVLPHSSVQYSLIKWLVVPVPS